MKKISSYCALLTLLIAACAPTSQPVPGPDKQMAGGIQGAITGAGAGAVTGAQMTAVTGPGVAIGAGFGALAGGIQGAFEDSQEEAMMQISAKTRYQRRRAEAQSIIEDFYNKRLALHPTRDIYPADVFFVADTARLSGQGKMVIAELARLNKERLPFSRLVIATYVKASDEKSDFAKYLSEKRAIQMGDEFIRNGIEPRRIETRPVIVSTPVLVDPDDKPSRYAQAIELIPVDR